MRPFIVRDIQSQKAEDVTKEMLLPAERHPTRNPARNSNSVGYQRIKRPGTSATKNPVLLFRGKDNYQKNMNNSKMNNQFFKNNNDSEKLVVRRSLNEVYKELSSFDRPFTSENTQNTCILDLNSIFILPQQQQQKKDDVREQVFKKFPKDNNRLRHSLVLPSKVSSQDPPPTRNIETRGSSPRNNINLKLQQVIHQTNNNDNEKSLRYHKLNFNSSSQKKGKKLIFEDGSKLGISKLLPGTKPVVAEHTKEKANSIALSIIPINYNNPFQGQAQGRNNSVSVSRGQQHQQQDSSFNDYMEEKTERSQVATGRESARTPKAIYRPRIPHFINSSKISASHILPSAAAIKNPDEGDLHLMGYYVNQSLVVEGMKKQREDSLLKFKRKMLNASQEHPYDMLNLRAKKAVLSYAETPRSPDSGTDDALEDLMMPAQLKSKVVHTRLKSFGNEISRLKMEKVATEKSLNQQSAAVAKDSNNNTNLTSQRSQTSSPSKRSSMSFVKADSKDMKDKEDPIFVRNFEIYKDYLMKINFSFNILIKTTSERIFPCYKYYLGNGNNQVLIRSLLRQRWWWSQTDNKKEANFIWTQIRVNTFIESLKPRLKQDNAAIIPPPQKTAAKSIPSLTDCLINNKSENHPESSSPESTRKSSIANLNNGNKSPKTQSIINSSLLLNNKLKPQEPNTVEKFVHLFTPNESRLMKINMTIPKSQGIAKFADYEELCKLKKGSSFQLVSEPQALKMCNHLENNFHLGNKKALLWNMKRYYESIKDNVFNYLPLTYHIKNGLADPEFQRFVQVYEAREKEISKSSEENPQTFNIWIVKPGEDTNRGNGINVCSDLYDIKEIISSKDGNRTYLIQEYLCRPLLYKKRKFDIRCYFMICGINGLLKGYWYKEGYIRTASKEFNLKNVHNKQIHLTNDAVQKKFDDYGKFEYGNKLSFADFQKYLETEHGGNADFYSQIYPQLKSLATDSIRAVYGKIDPNKREHCFEVFGLDFMIDEDLKVWLIEINTNPDITTTSPTLTRIIPNMVENALRIGLDPMFPPPYWPPTKKSLVPENLIDQNKFELVFDEVEDGPALSHLLNFDNGGAMELIFEQEEDQQEGEEDNGL